MTTEEYEELSHRINLLFDIAKDIRGLLDETMKNKMIDKKFGKLLVLNHQPKIKMKARDYIYVPAYDVMCDCGTVFVINHFDLEQGAVLMCDDCFNNTSELNE